MTRSLNPCEAYAQLKTWVGEQGSDLSDAQDSIQRMQAFAHCVAAVRLTHKCNPTEPPREAVKAIVVDYLGAKAKSVSGKELENLVGQTLERLIGEAAAKLIRSTENQ